MPLITTAARCLMEVAEAGSIRRAAELMNLSASAVNRQILNLEEELGARLLERLPRGVALTPAGTLVLSRLTGFRDEIDRLHRDLNQLVAPQQISVTIGIMDCLVGDAFTQFLRQIAERFPEVTLHIEVAFLASDLLTRLEAGEIDLVVAFDPSEQYGFWVIGAVQAPVGVIVPPGHPFAGRTGIDLKDCYAERLFVPDRSMILGRLVQTALPDRLRFVPFRTNSMRLIRETVRQNAGITFMNIIDVWNDIRTGTLAFVPLRDPVLSTRLTFCVRDRHGVRKEVRTIARSMQAMVEDEVTRLLSSRATPA